MAGKNKKDRLSPPLMYAFRAAHEARDAKKTVDLRDQSGERIIAGRRIAPRVAITEPALKREVAHDLEDLMNTIALESTLDLEEFDHVLKSVLNYGIPDITHRSIDELSVTDIKDEIRIALTRYEPRLVPETIRVTSDSEAVEADLKVRFVVLAELMCDPVSVPVQFVADVELDSGKIVIGRM
jgi:type VI secretion system protein ImpF